MKIMRLLLRQEEEEALAVEIDSRSDDPGTQ
jgi:hypothetical protein